MGDCDALLELTDGSEKSFTIRVADQYIHALFRYPNAGDLADLQEAFDNYSVDRLERHRQHEEFLQMRFQGCEHEIFNDPTVQYPVGRSYLSGRTGTMSQLIMNGYYNYYVFLVEELGVEANFVVDAQLLLTHLIESADLTKFTEQEQSSVQRIFQLANMHEGFQVPSRAWWQSVLNYFSSKRAAAENWEFWQNNPDRRSWRGFWEWEPSRDMLETPRPRIPRAEGLEEGETFSTYEYYPFIPKHQDGPEKLWGFNTGVGEREFRADYNAAIIKFEDLRDFFAPVNNNRGGKPRRGTRKNKRTNRKNKSKSKRRI